MSARVPPVEPPYPERIQNLLGKLMPADAPYEPLLLFRVLALHPELAERMRPMASGLLNKGLLSARDRELAISRITARAGAEYEWGVHVVVFGPAVGLDREVFDAVAARDVWPDPVLLTAVDELHDEATWSAATWSALRDRYDDAQVIELLLLVGWYRTLSTVINALEIPLESWGARSTAFRRAGRR
ncbi:carboxymuconolactone decarboxylase [Kribbella sp. ALI-6-A]|uniref:carboxymuconolactone decarboxylase family protein n=1 Tax=Kribbella sp. ALI-6-A TaxID=1933817 RepID=UPI00097BF304|nr:carboxymuconolactone decarboxylase family protein [Kribbella sp. ALI-6-A]ONI74230.1 carboxymuconolactone decarboxylase [Kribbella sp. ALI-6-A]